MADDSAGESRGSRYWGRVLAWVGGATAVITLVVGAIQLFDIVGERTARSRESAELVALARQQASRGEFEAAWRSLDDAEARARSDGTDAARLDVAFGWLQEARPGPGQPFSRITTAVKPALDRALLDPAHPRRADVLAHIGWAAFLDSRDTGTGDPAARYQEALALDDRNVYANAMFGHWVLWRSTDLERARRHFQTALESGRERAFVRTLQLAALRNRNEPAEPELMRVANEMRVQNEPLDARTARAVALAYRRRYGPRPVVHDGPGVEAAPADLLATYEWLLAMPGVAGNPDVSAHVRQTLRAAAAASLPSPAPGER
jgi:hypothetical protein